MDAIKMYDGSFATQRSALFLIWMLFLFRCVLQIFIRPRFVSVRATTAVTECALLALIRIASRLEFRLFSSYFSPKIYITILSILSSITSSKGTARTARRIGVCLCVLHNIIRCSPLRYCHFQMNQSQPLVRISTDDKFPDTWMWMMRLVSSFWPSWHSAKFALASYLYIAVSKSQISFIPYSSTYVSASLKLRWH